MMAANLTTIREEQDLQVLLQPWSICADCHLAIHLSRFWRDLSYKHNVRNSRENRGLRSERVIWFSVSFDQFSPTIFYYLRLRFACSEGLGCHQIPRKCRPYFIEYSVLANVPDRYRIRFYTVFICLCRFWMKEICSEVLVVVEFSVSFDHISSNTLSLAMV